MITEHAHISAYYTEAKHWTDIDIRDRLNVLPGLNSLVLYGPGITDYGMKLLECCTQLRELHLVDTNITDKGLASVGKLKSLRWLRIDTANVTDSGIRSLNNLHLLEGLQIVKTKSSDEGFLSLLTFPKLSYLEASGCPITELGISCIAQVRGLNSLRLAAPTICDNSFLGLSTCKNLTNFSFDMPLVSQDAVLELHSKLPHCALSHYQFYRPEEKVLFLVNNFLGANNTMSNFTDALLTADELLSYSPFHPALHGARALINYRMGNYDIFRNDLINARDNANIHGQADLVDLAMTFLAQETLFGLKLMMEHQRPERMIAGKLITGGVRPPIRREPIAALINKLYQMTNVPADIPAAPRQMSSPIIQETWATPAYNEPQIIVQVNRQIKIILPKNVKDEMKSVPWNW